MFQERWKYTNNGGLTKWYGHVDYYEQYVIGQWFVLNAETGVAYWSRRYCRPNNVVGCTNDVIIASEMRSDGPWTCDFGIYAIDVKTGDLRWTSHSRGLWGNFLRWLDYVPGFTNELRDAPEYVVDKYIVTRKKRVIDARDGHDDPSSGVSDVSPTKEPRQDRVLYDNKSLEIDGEVINVEGHGNDFAIYRIDDAGREAWRFEAKACSMYVDGNFYSYRYNEGRIFLILGDAPKFVPIHPDKPMMVKSNPANYQLGVLDTTSGDLTLHELKDASNREECRIEAIRDARMLVSCDGSQLVEYELTI